MTRDELCGKLREYNVVARRYYPIIPDFPCYRGVFNGVELNVARRVASRILTLPLYSDLGIERVDKICDMVEYFHFHSRLPVAKLEDELTAEVAMRA